MLDAIRLSANIPLFALHPQPCLEIALVCCNGDAAARGQIREKPATGPLWICHSDHSLMCCGRAFYLLSNGRILPPWTCLPSLASAAVGRPAVIGGVRSQPDRNTAILATTERMTASRSDGDQVAR